MHTTTSRLQQIAAMYVEHRDQLQRVVERRSTTDPQTVEDACSHAWTQLLTHPDVELGPPRWRALAWLTQTAVHEAWRLERRRGDTISATEDDLEAAAAHRGAYTATNDELADQHARIELVREIPERPRRFLLRLALGYSYEEIAIQENASLRTTDRQIARAKRALREIEERERGGRR